MLKPPSKREEEVDIHPTAIISTQAKLGAGVRVGPYAIIGDNVVIGDHNIIESHVVIEGWTEIGHNNHFYPYTVIGTPPQDLKFKGEKTQIIIGNNNIFREFITVNLGTQGGGGVTTIGDNNFFMAYSHIAHDCKVGNGVIFYNAGTLAGHVEVEDFATVGAFSGVHQYCVVGKYSFIGGYSVITRDVLPYSKTVGNRAKTYGVNFIGLRRKEFSSEAIQNIKSAYQILFQSKLNTTQALEKIESELKNSPEVSYLVDFIRRSKRGIVK